MFKRRFRKRNVKRRFKRRRFNRRAGFRRGASIRSSKEAHYGVKVTVKETNYLTS